MFQPRLTYQPSYEGREAWLNQLELLRAAVHLLEPKNVLEQLDVAKSTLSQSLNEQADKRWAAEWTHTVKSMLSRRFDEPARKLLVQVCQADMEVTSLIVDEPRELTPQELAAAALSELARMGDEGRAAMDRIRALGKAKKK